MAKNQHRNLTGDALHNPKGFDGASNGTKPVKDGAGALDWITETQLPKALDYVSAQSAPPTEVTGDVYLIDTTGTAYDINTIAWQSGNTIRIAFNGSPDLSAVAANDYFITSGNGNSSNDGTFIITTVNDGSDYIEITNNDRSDATDDEATDAVGTGYYTLAEWDAVSKVSHVTFDGSIWSSITPSEGQSCYDVALGAIRVFDGTDWSSSLGSGGGGLTDIVDDTTPQLGGTLDANGNTIDMGTNTITDTKVGQWDTAYGWGDHSGQGYVTATSEANNRIAVFTGTDAIEGDANLTWTGSTLKINSNNALTPNNFSSITGNYLASQVETNDANCLLYGYGTSNSGELVLASARGTIGSSTAVQSGDILGEIQGMGHSGTAFRQGGQFLFKAGENYVETSNYGSTFALRLVPNGSTTLATRYTIDGDGDHTFTGNVGMGTSPSVELHAKGSGEIVRIESTTATGDGIMSFHDAGGEQGTIGFDSGSNVFAITNKLLVGAAGDIVFRNDVGSGSSYFDVLTIKGNGDTEVNGNLIADENVIIKGQASFPPQTLTPTGTSQAINWTNGNVVILDLGSATGDVTLSFTNETAGASYFIQIIQGSVSRNVEFPVEVKFAGETGIYTLAVTPTNNAIDVVALTCVDDTNGSEVLLANVSQNYG